MYLKIETFVLHLRYNNKLIDLPALTANLFMENLHILKTSYLGATNTQGARIKIYSERFRESVLIAYDYSFNSALDIAIHWLQTKGFEIIGKGEGQNNMYVISSTFEPLKK